MASSSLSSLDFDLQTAARAGLHSLHSFISLFSLQPSASSSSLHVRAHLQPQLSMAASETIAQFKHLGSLLSQRTGHARVRQAPRIAVTTRSDSLLHSPNSPPIAPNFPSVNLNSPPLDPNFRPGNPSSATKNPNLPSGNPNSPSISPNLPSSASEGFQFSQIELPATQATASTSFEESNSGSFDDEGQSRRGNSHNIDLNYHNNDHYEGNFDKIFSKRGFYIEANQARDNYSPIINYNYNDKHNNDHHIPNSFDLNQQAPSLDSPLEKSKYNDMLTTSSAFPPPSQESFAFDARTQSAATLSLAPSVSNTPYASSDDDFTEFANPNQRLTVYEGYNKGSLSRQLAQVFSTNTKFEAQLEKAASLIPTPTHSCISLEGSLPAYGSLPRVQNPQARMDHHPSSAGKRRCPSILEDDSKCGNSPSKCHCSKRRKLKNKSIKRVPAISDKVAEIPNDDYSWRKYGQKPIKGSPYPRGYYKCSGVKGCPAKKHVERAIDDPSMLIVTYDGDHIHSRPLLEEPSRI